MDPGSPWHDGSKTEGQASRTQAARQPALVLLRVYGPATQAELARAILLPRPILVRGPPPTLTHGIAFRRKEAIIKIGSKQEGHYVFNIPASL